jgi:hypothetical protein
VVERFSVNIKFSITVTVLTGDNMKTIRRKQLLIGTLLTAFLVTLVLVPAAQALSSSFNDSAINYLVVSGTPDAVKPGGTVTVVVTAKLSDLYNESDVLHIKIFADTASESAKVLSQGDLVLPAGPNATAATATYSVSIPSDAITNTYLYATINDNLRMYSRISLSLIQPHTYSELQSQINTLQSQNNDLRATNSTTNLLLYIALAVAALFIVTTVYILSLTLRGTKKRRQNELSSSSSP